MGLIRDDEVVVKLASKRRARRSLIAELGRIPDAACSFRYDTGAGAYVVTRTELAVLKAAERARGKKLVSLVRDQSAFFRCWNMK